LTSHVEIESHTTIVCSSGQTADLEPKCSNKYIRLELKSLTKEKGLIQS